MMPAGKSMRRERHRRPRTRRGHPRASSGSPRWSSRRSGTGSRRSARRANDGKAAGSAASEPDGPEPSDARSGLGGACPEAGPPAPRLARVGARSSRSWPGWETSRATAWMSLAIFSRGYFSDDGWPSFEAMTAFGPLLTTVADTGGPSEVAMSWTRMPWFARLTMTLDDVAEPELTGQVEELCAVAQCADLGRHDEEDLVGHREHRHGAIVVAGVVVHDHVGMVVLRPSAVPRAGGRP